MSSKTIPDTLCWSCQRATGKCSWSESFTPVEGWNAIDTALKIQHKNQILDSSYCVLECPLYVAD